MNNNSDLNDDLQLARRSASVQAYSGRRRSKVGSEDRESRRLSLDSGVNSALSRPPRLRACRWGHRVIG